MPSVTVQDLPDTLRVQLSEEGATALWGQIEEKEGVTAVAEQYGHPRSKLYNWKHKQSFLPATFVAKLLPGADQYVVAVKGEGRSVPTTLSDFPLRIGKELLTRADCSAHVNAQGVPTYHAQDPGLANRFIELLREPGEVPISVYHRSAYEVRYPKYWQDIFESLQYEAEFAAVVDESGRIEDGNVVANGYSVPVDEFSGELYHRGKRLQLALARGDTATITQLMATEAQKVQELVE